MGKPHRISAGGLIFKGGKVLLVRYQERHSSGTYLVGPGGKLEQDENVLQAIIRETKEETGVTVRPQRVVAIEDLVSSRWKMIKVWLICEAVEGKIRKTVEAEKEGILSAGWFTRKQLPGEVVYPTLLVEQDWDQLRNGCSPVVCLPSRKARF